MQQRGGQHAARKAENGSEGAFQLIHLIIVGIIFLVIGGFLGASGRGGAEVLTPPSSL